MRWVFHFQIQSEERRVGILVVGGKLATFKKSFENVLETLKKTLMDLPEQNKCGKKLSFLLNIIPLFFIINRSNPYGRKRGYCCLGNKLFAYQTLREKRPYSEFSGPHFTAFGLNTECGIHSPNAGKCQYGHFLRSQSSVVKPLHG